MKLLFVRHAEPDYVNDTLTPNGWEEAKILAQRIKDWKVTQFYVSSQGRAKDTALYSLQIQGKEAIELPFMREFSYPTLDPVTDRIGVPWDYVPSYWTNEPHFFEYEDGFLKSKTIKSNEDLAKNYPLVINGFDDILRQYGYTRNGKYYINENATERFLKGTTGANKAIVNNGPDLDKDETTLVFFCHLGVTCMVLSHLLNIPFECLVHGFYIPPTGVTIVSTEERWGKEASFRVQAIGDVSHLKEANHPISPAGSFANPFQM